MIYIFEDRPSRRQNHEEIVKDYSDKICFVKFDIDPSQDLNEFIIDHFHDAECVLFHKSYSFKNKDINIDRIRSTLVGDYAVRFCIFSGDTEQGSIDSDGILTVNADVMYGNLPSFLQAFRKTGLISFETLLWGENEQLNKKLAAQARLHIAHFIDKDLSLEVDDSEIEEILKDSVDEGLFTEDEVKTIKESIEGPVTWGKLLELVQSKID